MSVEARPISPSRFALAIRDLPLENLYSKAREIENSISHLERSNSQLQTYSDSIKQDQTIDGQVREEVGDKECLEAIKENEIVIERQRERVNMLKTEAERRGQFWHDGNGDQQESERDGDGRNSTSNGSGQRRERLNDDELRRRMEERMRDEAEEDPDEEGMHL